jgi:hypothetical protein
MKNKILQELIDKSPYPIKMGVKRGDNDYDKSCGGYCQHCPPKIVVMAQSKHNYERLYFLAHEIQHALCNKTDCFCMCMRSRYYREYHALKHSIEACMENKKAIKFCVAQFTRPPWDTVLFTKHLQALKNLKKTKLWRRALRAARKK